MKATSNGRQHDCTWLAGGLNVMAEVLASFATPVGDNLGSYYARAVGRQAGDRMWEGWIEFLPVDGGTRAAYINR